MKTNAIASPSPRQTIWRAAQSQVQPHQQETQKTPPPHPKSPQSPPPMKPGTETSLHTQIQTIRDSTTFNRITVYQLLKTLNKTDLSQLKKGKTAVCMGVIESGINCVETIKQSRSSASVYQLELVSELLEAGMTAILRGEVDKLDRDFKAQLMSQVKKLESFNKHHGENNSQTAFRMALVEQGLRNIGTTETQLDMLSRRGLGLAQGIIALYEKDVNTALTHFQDLLRPDRVGNHWVQEYVELKQILSAGADLSGSPELYEQLTGWLESTLKLRPYKDVMLGSVRDRLSPERKWGMMSQIRLAGDLLKTSQNPAQQERLITLITSYTKSPSTRVRAGVYEQLLMLSQQESQLSERLAVELAKVQAVDESQVRQKAKQRSGYESYRTEIDEECRLMEAEASRAGNLENRIEVLTETLSAALNQKGDTGLNAEEKAHYESQLQQLKEEQEELEAEKILLKNQIKRQKQELAKQESEETNQRAGYEEQLATLRQELEVQEDKLSQSYERLEAKARELDVLEAEIERLKQEASQGKGTEALEEQEEELAVLKHELEGQERRLKLNLQKQEKQEAELRELQSQQEQEHLQLTQQAQELDKQEQLLATKERGLKQIGEKLSQYEQDFNLAADLQMQALSEKKRQVLDQEQHFAIEESKRMQLFGKWPTVKVETSEKERLYARIDHHRVPPYLKCPITMELIREAVTLMGNGQTYEKEAIERWIGEGHQTDPLTGEILRTMELQKNYALQGAIDWYVDQDLSNEQVNAVQSESAAAQIRVMQTGPEIKIQGGGTITEAGLKARLGEGQYVGVKAYEKLGIEVTELPEISQKLLEGIEWMKAQGHEPMMVYDHGLSMLELDERLKRYQPEIKFYNDKWHNESFATATGRPGWLVIPTSDQGIEPGSRAKTYSKQERGKNARYEIGSARQLSTVAMLAAVETGRRLFPDSPKTYGRTTDHSSAYGNRASLGRFASSGLRVYAFYEDSSYHYVGLLVFLRT